ncbi:MAG: hypothetical protein QG671_2067 [Actinomycetota bacterium]|nr:hypothetical protein [Actinomycetota bacterium]
MHAGGMVIVAGLAIVWVLIVVAVGLVLIVWGAGTFLTPGAPQSMRIVAAFIIANLIVLAGSFLIRGS